ncbi:O-fucosyltransferase 37 isoform X2 [Andrographis paniculata]|uniref:O-fucosyltransferase 37 isoform X2 n=1 Tax=Andrographis paniculata TaxID=175694 RepID=UPI0021E9266D|nr:O-fucosyltransferase 37 isoform X2 [Andrographis paniculata]
MAKPPPRAFKTACITLTPPCFPAVSPFFFIPKKPWRLRSPYLTPLFLLCTFLCLCLLTLHPPTHPPPPCPPLPNPSPIPPLYIASLSSIWKDHSNHESVSLSTGATVPLPPRGPPVTVNASAAEFWRQPDGEGYRPCLDFSLDYRKASAKIAKEKRRFLVVVVSGGLNQQRNQIVDAVVMARILEAALVVPVLEVNRVWKDESEFSDIFDLEHFKKTLQSDVRIVSSLPSTYLVSKQSIENQIPAHVSPLNEEGFLILKGLESRLSKNLPTDLQKLRCKVAFHALRFASQIRDLGEQVARRMWIEGPYVAIHLRMEKDVWVRTGCPTGLGSEYDNAIAIDRKSNPDFLTDKLNMTKSARRLAGLCPLNAREVARLLKALGAPRDANIYVAGGEPFGGSRALQPLVDEFPNIATKLTLARKGELEPYLSKPSILAAIDYIVSLSSDVFVPSHGGNMGRAMQGHRAYVGHRKHIKPNKRMMLPLLDDAAAAAEEEVGKAVRRLHKYSMGQPESRRKKIDRDVLAYPVPECMCKS